MAAGEGNRPDYVIAHDTVSPPILFSEEPLVHTFLSAGTANRFPGSEPVPGQSEAVNVFRVNYIVHNHKGPMVEHMIRVSPNKAVANVLVSPDGGRIFFEERSQAKDPLPESVYHLIPALRPHNHKEKCVFVVRDLKTGRRKELAYYEGPYPHKNFEPQLYAQQIKWAPDGKKISFVWDQNLFTIASD